VARFFAVCLKAYWLFHHFHDLFTRFAADVTIWLSHFIRPTASDDGCLSQMIFVLISVLRGKSNIVYKIN
jgi:hypothetical protein